MSRARDSEDFQVLIGPQAIIRRIDRVQHELEALKAVVIAGSAPVSSDPIEALVSEFRGYCMARDIEFVDIGNGEERVYEDTAGLLLGKSAKTLRNWRLYDDPLPHIRHRDDRNVERETYLVADLARYVIAHPRKFGTGTRTGAVRPDSAKAIRTEEESYKMFGNRQGFVRYPQNPEKGIRFARYVRCLGLAKKAMCSPAEIARAIYDDEVLEDFIIKANVSAGSVGGTTWGHQLVGDETDIITDFVDVLRAKSIIGKFGTNGIPALHPAIFRTPLLSQTAGGTGHWIGEGKPIPLTKQAFARTTLDALKVAAITPITVELLKRSAPQADVMIRDDLVKSLSQRLDLSFVDPGNAGEAGVSPASITNGLTPVGSTGNDADAIRADLALLFAEFDAVEQPLDDGVFLMSSGVTRKLSLMRNAFGVKEFPGLTVNGGALEGIPIITSNTISPDTGGHMVILVNASDIWLGDEGGVEIDMADQASLNMVDNPTTPDALTPTEAETVSLWQTDAVAFRAKREINWKKRRSTAVAYLNNVNWGVTGS